LCEAFFMFWETLWPLILGFGLSGVVQAFVPKHRMEAWRWNYTTWLNFIFLGLFAVLYWLYRNRDRLAGAQDYASA
jgi:hypothetical protein